MPFVTTLRLKSDNRATLDSVVEEIKRTAERKGIQVKGPHTRPPQSFRVPLFWHLDGTNRGSDWEYLVYERELRFSGHDETVRKILEWDFPEIVHIEMEVAQVRTTGYRS